MINLYLAGGQSDNENVCAPHSRPSSTREFTRFSISRVQTNRKVSLSPKVFQKNADNYFVPNLGDAGRFAASSSFAHCFRIRRWGFIRGHPDAVKNVIVLCDDMIREKC